MLSTLQVTETHPEVVELVDAAVRAAQQSEVALPPEVFIDAMEEAIQNAEASRREANPDGPA